MLNLFSPVLSFFVLALPAGPSLSEWSVNRFHWEGTISEGQHVLVTNEHGDIRIRGHQAPAIELWAVIQRKKGHPKPEFVIQEGEGPFELAVLLNSSETGEPAVPAEARQPRVDIVLYVPEQSSLEVRTADGLIEIRGANKHVTAGSISGPIQLRSSAGFSLISEFGDISVNVMEGDWDLPFLIETVTGNIQVDFPTRANIRISVSTSGEITSDYSITVSREQAMKKGVVSLGEGQATMTLRSERGSIKILERWGFPDSKSEAGDTI